MTAAAAKVHADRTERDALLLAALVDCEQWALGNRHAELLTENFVRRLHRRMMAPLARGAGRFRMEERARGVSPYGIGAAVASACADAAIQLHLRAFGVDEIAARLAHRLQRIDPFVEGGGLVARMMADLLLVAQGAERFGWGRGLAREAARERYEAALEAADGGDFSPLLAFART